MEARSIGLVSSGRATRDSNVGSSRREESVGALSPEWAADEKSMNCRRRLPAGTDADVARTTGGNGHAFHRRRRGFGFEQLRHGVFRLVDALADGVPNVAKIRVRD